MPQALRRLFNGYVLNAEILVGLMSYLPNSRHAEKKYRAPRVTLRGRRAYIMAIVRSPEEFCAACHTILVKRAMKVVTLQHKANRPSWSGRRCIDAPRPSSPPDACCLEKIAPQVALCVLPVCHGECRRCFPRLVYSYGASALRSPFTCAETPRGVRTPSTVCRRRPALPHVTVAATIRHIAARCHVIESDGISRIDVTPALYIAIYADIHVAACLRATLIRR